MSEGYTSFQAMNSVSEVVQQMRSESNNLILEGVSDKTEESLHQVSKDNTEGLHNFSQGNIEEIHNNSLNIEDGLDNVSQDTNKGVQNVSQDNNKNTHQITVINKEVLHSVLQDNIEDIHKVLQDDEGPHKVSQDDKGPHRVSKNDKGPHKVSQDEERPHKVSQDDEGPHKVSQYEERPHKVSQDEERPHKVSQGDEGPHKVSPYNTEHLPTASLDNGGTVNILNPDIVIKQEVVDFDYQSFSVQYRGKPIVVYSDSESESSSSSADLLVIPRALDEDCEEDGDEQLNRTHPHQSASQAVKKFVSRTEGEIFPEELPPLEYLTISPDENVELEPLGIVSGIVDVLVVVKAFTNSPALYDDTVLFLEGRRPLGLIFETFGTVHQPFYSVRFNCNKDIIEQNIELGNKVFFAPKASNLTKYVFISELRKVKFDDASWEHDNEPPPTHIEFSDDEEEKLAKQRQRNQFRRTDSANGVIAVRKKRRRNFPTENGHAESSGPQLLQGDLNRNPFGNGGHNYKGHGSKQWPPRANNLSSNKQWPPKEPSAGPLPTTQNTSRKSQSTYFGGKPNWQMQQMGYSPQLPGQPVVTGANNVSFVNTEQMPSFVNYTSTPGFNLNIPPPSFTSPGGSSYSCGPNNQSLSQFNPSQPPPFVSTLNTGSIQPNASPYPSNSSVQQSPSPYPANSSVQHSPSPYPANSSVQHSPSPYLANCQVQHLSSQYPSNSSVQPNAAHYPANSQMQHIASQYPANSPMQHSASQYTANSQMQHTPMHYPPNSQVHQPAAHFSSNSTVQYPANSPLSNFSPYYPANNPLPNPSFQYHVNSSTPHPPLS